MNSLATIRQGPAGTSSSAECQCAGKPSGSSRCSCTFRNVGLISTRCSTIAAQKARHRFCRAQRVDHHRSAPGAEFDQAHVFRRTHLLPDRRQPHADQFAEHLADLGRGDEIAAGADRVALDVIAVLRMGQAQPHVFGDRHRPGDADKSADFGFKRRDFVSHLSASVRYCNAYASMAIPININGMHNSIPIVRPPHRKPSCTSGSRKNSQVMRAMP